jgi:hypothetical protein
MGSRPTDSVRSVGPVQQPPSAKGALLRRARARLCLLESSAPRGGASWEAGLAHGSVGRQIRVLRSGPAGKVTSFVPEHVPIARSNKTEATAAARRIERVTADNPEGVFGRWPASIPLAVCRREIQRRLEAAARYLGRNVRTIGVPQIPGRPRPRSRRVPSPSSRYLTVTLLPLPCRKAGVPRGDVRGQITGHRARATIASQLYNAKDPMTLFELQAWLGHSSPSSTQHYARITPITLTTAYTDAGYFARNVRTIEVLLDRDAITNGTAAGGGPFEFYDLGHGYCSYSFFEQCPHRMACARCDFYIPKPSSQAQLLEGKDGLQRMLLQIPLTDEERAAAEHDQDVVDRLLDRLTDTPTPAGPTHVNSRPTTLTGSSSTSAARTEAQMPRADSYPQRGSSPGFPACLPGSGGLPPPSFADRRPDGFKVDMRLPSPRPGARFRVRPPAGISATSTTGSPQGGNQR